MKEKEIWEGVDIICNALRESEEYKVYEKARKALTREPEKIERVNAFREAKYKYQNGMSDGIRNTLEELLEINQELRHTVLYSQFLESEAKLCNMIRKVTERIMDVVEIEVTAEERKGEETDGGQ